MKKYLYYKGLNFFSVLFYISISNNYCYYFYGYK